MHLNQLIGSAAANFIKKIKNYLTSTSVALLQNKKKMIPFLLKGLVLLEKKGKQTRRKLLYNLLFDGFWRTSLGILIDSYNFKYQQTNKDID